MIELFTLLSLTKNDDKKQQETFQNYRRYPWNWVFMILIISFISIVFVTLSFLFKYKRLLCILKLY